MAVTITTDFTTLYDGSAAIGGATVVTLFPRFGSSHNAFQLGAATAHYTTTVTAFNFTNKRIYTWMIGPGGIDTIANGGYRIVIGDGTHTRAYFVGGRDVKNFTSQNWGCFILDADNLPTNFTQLAGTLEPNLSAITVVGIGMSSTAKAVGNSNNAFFDIMRYGTGLTIAGGTSGDPGTFNDILLEDDSTSNAWGIVESLGGGIYGVQGRLTFGSTSAATHFEDKNAIVVFGDRIVGPDTYKIDLLGSSSHINTFILGEKLGVGDSAVGINGCSILSPNKNVEIDLTATNFDNIGIYASTLNGLGTKDILLSDNTLHEFISNTVNASGQVVANNMIVRKTNFISTTSTLGSLLWNEDINIKESTFIANLTGAAIQHPDNLGDPYTYDELRFNGNTFDINNTSGFEITVNAINSANPSTSTGSSVIINNPTNFRITGLISDTEVRIYRQSDRFELAGVESSGTEFEYNYNYAGDVTVYIVIHKETYEYIKLRDVVLDENDRSIPVQQRFDRNFI
jgi:hypothetical protein